MSSENVDMTTHTPVPEAERLPSMSEIEHEITDQPAGMTPLDSMILDESLIVDGFSAYTDNARRTRIWVRRLDKE